MNIGYLPALHARYRGDHLAVVFGNERLSYREFNARINRLANGLLRAGVSKGNHIATILPNCISVFVTKSGSNIDFNLLTVVLAFANKCAQLA